MVHIVDQLDRISQILVDMVLKSARTISLQQLLCPQIFQCIELEIDNTSYPAILVIAVSSFVRFLLW